MMVLLWYWFAQQMAPHQPRLVMDMGILIVILWFVLMPYYLWRHERWHGMLKVACLFALYVGSWVLSAVVSVALT
jgi:hypothetical protein